MQLAGKAALITGGGSGIGRALAVEASRRGMAVALVGRRPTMLHETRAGLASPGDCLVLPGDVTLPATRQAVRGRIAEEWGRLHVLVNNAGVIAAGPLVETPDAALDSLMTTNVTAPLAMIRELLPLLRTDAPARVVNVGSMLGDIAMPLFAAYSASKFALRGLSNALRRELRSCGVGVTYAAPRGARTDATQAVARFVEPLGMPLDSTETIARRIWDAVAEERDSVYPGGRERFFTLVERLFPSLVDRALAKQFEAGRALRPVENAVPLLHSTTAGCAIPPPRD